MAELTEEEQEILRRMLKDDALRDQIPPSERIPVTHPEKYAFPVGRDDRGRPFDREGGEGAEGSRPHEES